MITKAQAIQSLRPGAQWSMTDDILDWLDAEQTQPTETEIQAELARLQQLEPLRQRIADLKNLLTDSDYKVLPDYDRTNDAIKAQRQAWREEIRALELQLVR